MNKFSLTHLADHELRNDLVSANGARCAADAQELARVAEFDARKLYLPEGYPSMHQFCVHELKYSDDEADARIRVARAAHDFPAIFPMIQDRRLNQSAVLRLARRLTPENAENLLAAAANRTKDELALLLAERFPRPDLPTLVMAIGPGDVGAESVGGATTPNAQQIPPVPERVRQLSRAKVTPLAPHRFEYRFSTGQELHDLVGRAHDLLGYAVPAGDVGEVFLRAMRVFVDKLEKRRCASTNSPQPRRASKNPRHIPAAVRRAVWARDGGQCTFVSEQGHRCESRRGLQFDHIKPVASGGETTIANIRLLCPAHNQHAADRALGRGFMDEKRRDAQRRTAEARAQKDEADARRAQARAAAARAKTAEDELLAAAADVLPALKNLGARRDELLLAAKRCAEIPAAPQDKRMVQALRCLGRAKLHQSRQVAGNSP